MVQHSPTYSAILNISRELEHDLVRLDFESLAIHESVKSYFRFDLTKIQYVSECNSFILYHILRNQDLNHDGLTIVDHGAGLGLFSFLVKRLGFTCISHDISNEYIDGIKIIGNQIKALPDHFVTGDTDALIDYCQIHQIQPNGLGSRNVIEHLPDYKQFFEDLHRISKPGFVAVITTSANIHNPLVKKIHLKIHEQYEEVGSNTDMDNPTLNTANCGIKIRSEIIRQYAPQLDTETVHTLARRNRGFMKQEIIARVKEFIHSGKLPVPLPEPSNTRDPFSGAWVERLVPYQNYKTVAEANSFEFELIPGFYNTHYPSFIKNIVSNILNTLLKIKNPWSIKLSPFLAMKLRRGL